ncbi:MAG: bifunctional demethylmenaquinone methyltransferase/2-methoxy-6-polyprenyl-1,4-benzoquinol methylase UbiE [Helicobacter sp.]|nr:bifunctional demethylmenaquinone methyltransferase/2-methoxy-6-polyprenyl-1,4-benzoquinol methylase UbiE [Helicobacter sp.]MDD7566887.1 bifunctional demethylmenaquinone methyltransferase/2-methoxy-6-polyprenyl-1,4-benzoquinol methylase UbiE [Helicobacter sp.]MDY5740698.1 bifunctional demethylmenaquinone methyltransferase/2-methoxy-6-polyprenyl-1,4-benzoquinol methylase UbiE [Helicobacter sp.]
MSTKDKQQQIISMFDSIAKTYDVTNHALSLGIDTRWRKEACKKTLDLLSKNSNLRLLDVACGSGDMIKHWIDTLNESNVQDYRIYGLEPSVNMLEIARKKLEGYGCVGFSKSEAKILPYGNESMDIVSIAYGLRNILEYELALDEFARVLKKGGVLVVLEFLKTDNTSMLGKFMGFYTRKILPLVGGLISGNFRAYKYLPDSIESFITLERLQDLSQARGIQKSVAKSYSGICTLYIGVKS